MSAFRPGAPAAARAPLICNWRSYAMGCGVAPPAALVSAFEKLVHMNSMFNMLFFLLFRRRRQRSGRGRTPCAQAGVARAAHAA
ncbi:hypothetical protein A8H40_20630 [Burkholderia multivorans]|uniref:Uncharacterized protein n=1 Tax=Burkholderia multivorans CGD2 TaxID=513052 RepID=B9BNF1_9BURK|nr:hypothetical protein A8H40_20630 [Burkholderia multivorans]EEE08161.1 hypothetical protein BURMUCGD2_2381 [Burkholderia multivorans CGD2]EEE10490.1 hypothetical protein BURMUCGD2M_2467 [Burkholderia multivorans CGD2M]EJO52691.1 hypothetical protein BURMUCF1_1140 [Burkholderia multivorans ATCC BAA-247]PRF38963.1 hypothetical protein C6Q08_01385 [Burkholderia multivorans]